MSQSVDWLAISPALCLVVAAVVALLGDTFVPAARSWLADHGQPGRGHGCARPDRARCRDRERRSASAGHRDRGWAARGASTTSPRSGGWPCSSAPDWSSCCSSRTVARAASCPAGELHLLLLASATGALGVAASGDLVTLLVSIETVSLPAFAMVGLRADRRGAEAAMKFFLVSVVATAFSLLGISMVYGATGSVVAMPVATAGSERHGGHSGHRDGDDPDLGGARLQGRGSALPGVGPRHLCGRARAGRGVPLRGEQGRRSRRSRHRAGAVLPRVRRHVASADGGCGRGDDDRRAISRRSASIMPSGCSPGPRWLRRATSWCRWRPAATSPTSAPCSRTWLMYVVVNLGAFAARSARLPGGGRSPWPT